MYVKALLIAVAWKLHVNLDISLSMGRNDGSWFRASEYRHVVYQKTVALLLISHWLIPVTLH